MGKLGDSTRLLGRTCIAPGVYRILHPGGSYQKMVGRRYRPVRHQIYGVSCMGRLVYLASRVSAPPSPPFDPIYLVILLGSDGAANAARFAAVILFTV